MPDGEQLYRWFWRSKLGDRHGQFYRLIARGARNSCLIEFVSDGWRVITSRNALRKVSAAREDGFPDRPAIVARAREATDG